MSTRAPDPTGGSSLHEGAASNAPLSASNPISTSDGNGASGVVLVSRFVAALVLFFALNLAWSQTTFGLMSATDFPHETWTGTAIDDFLKDSTRRPEIAFLGSSLMVTPMIRVDGDYTGKKIDAPYHHRSVFFQDQLKALTGKQISTFNFAIPGEMPSDAYFLTKFLLKNEKRPNLIVYGVGPRDFIDNLLPSASATDPFKHLSRLGDVTDHMPLLLSDWQDWLNYEIGRACFTFAHKEDLACSTQRTLSSMLNPHLPPESPQAEWEYKQMVIPDYQQFAVIPSECMISPTKPGAEDEFKDNIAEYRDRYRELKWDTFLSQMEFLSETLELAKDRGIRTIVVAMPITQGNREIMSDSVWRLYKGNLRVIAKAGGAEFIDMAKMEPFQNADFADTVHLNARGGTKLLKVLASEIAGNNSVMTALVHKGADEGDKTLPHASLFAGLKEGRL